MLTLRYAYRCNNWTNWNLDCCPRWHNIPNWKSKFWFGWNWWPFHFYGIRNEFIFASLLIHEFKNYGVGLGSFWIMIIAYMRLALALNTLNQIIFGITIGIWLSCFVFFIINFDNKQTFHFQMVIRGRMVQEFFGDDTKDA